MAKKIYYFTVRQTQHFFQNIKLKANSARQADKLVNQYMENQDLANISNTFHSMDYDVDMHSAGGHSGTEYTDVSKIIEEL